MKLALPSVLILVGLALVQALPHGPPNASPPQEASPPQQPNASENT
jgi:hypothetical protein